jgi:hypothetical protein
VRFWNALSLVTLVLVGGCASSPVVRNLPEFRESALSGRRVAFVRLAVSDDLGDARTGIVMSARTRTLATLSACASVSRSWSAGRVICLVPSNGEPTAELLELERFYAEAMNETKLSYTVSAVLVDLRTMKPLRGALHSRSASRTVKHNVGFAEAPSAAPLLAEIMSELGEAVLDD